MAVTDAGTPVVLAGVHGHGRSHLANLARIAAAGGGPHGIRLAGICDPVPLTPEQRERVGDVPVDTDLARLIDRVGAAVAVVCTPIHTHADLTRAAVGRGAHVLLEKPPAPSLAGFEQLAAAVATAGRACQVGFQSLGSEAVVRVRDLVAEGAVGEVTGIGATCVWVRDGSYYARARWAGRRVLDGVPVVDGVLTNPFAHATATALRLDGSDGPGGVAGGVSGVELELYRVNDIEADDTSCLRLRTARGTTIVVAATLAGETSHDPVIVVHGTTGRIELYYKRDEVRLRQRPGGVERVWQLGTRDLLENLVGHVRAGAPLLVPLPRTAAFMQVVEAVRTAPDPTPVIAGAVRDEPSGKYRRRFLPGVDDAAAACAERLALFSELELPWAS